MIRKHNRRAAKAAFAIALGVAIVLGGAAAAPAALEQRQATPIIVGTKNFPEQYVLGQLYKQALGGKGLQGPVQGEHRLDGADRRVAPQRPRDAVSRVHGDHAVGHVQAEDAAEVGPRHLPRGEGPVRETRADAAEADAVPGPGRDRGAPDDGDEVRPEDGRRPAQGPGPDARGVPGVRDAVAAAAREPLRRQERRVHAAGRDQRLLAAQLRGRSRRRASSRPTRS